MKLLPALRDAVHELLRPATPLLLQQDHMTWKTRDQGWTLASQVLPGSCQLFKLADEESCNLSSPRRQEGWTLALQLLYPHRRELLDDMFSGVEKLNATEDVKAVADELIAPHEDTEEEDPMRQEETTENESMEQEQKELQKPAPILDRFLHSLKKNNESLWTQKSTNHGLRPLIRPKLRDDGNSSSQYSSEVPELVSLQVLGILNSEKELAIHTMKLMRLQWSGSLDFEVWLCKFEFLHKSIELASVSTENSENGNNVSIWNAWNSCEKNRTCGTLVHRIYVLYHRNKLIGTPAAEPREATTLNSILKQIFRTSASIEVRKSRHSPLYGARRSSIFAAQACIRFESTRSYPYRVGDQWTQNCSNKKLLQIDNKPFLQHGEAIGFRFPFGKAPSDQNSDVDSDAPWEEDDPRECLNPFDKNEDNRIVASMEHTTTENFVFPDGYLIEIKDSLSFNSKNSCYSKALVDETCLETIPHAIIPHTEELSLYQPSYEYESAVIKDGSICSSSRSFDLESHVSPPMEEESRDELNIHSKIDYSEMIAQDLRIFDDPAFDDMLLNPLSEIMRLALIDANFWTP